MSSSPQEKSWSAHVSCHPSASPLSQLSSSTDSTYSQCPPDSAAHPADYYYPTHKCVHTLGADGQTVYPASCPAHLLPPVLNSVPFALIAPVLTRVCEGGLWAGGRWGSCGGVGDLEWYSNSSNFPPCQQTPKTDGSCTRNPFSST